jgi:hypothetical protein
MGVKASRGKYTVDKDASVVLRDIADGAEVATATEAAVSLKQLVSASWHNKEIPHGDFVVAVDVSAGTFGGGHSYVLSLQVDDVEAQNDSPVTVASYTIPAVGAYNFVLDSKVIEALDPDNSSPGKWLAIKLTASGDTPSLTYGAFIAKSIRG